MTMFVGGPYDGQDLPVDGQLSKRVRLPHPDQMNPYLQECDKDPASTQKLAWPYIYMLDETADPPQFRYVPNEKK